MVPNICFAAIALVGALTASAHGSTVKGHQATQAAYDVKSDKNLAKPVTLSIKYGAIDAVLKSISRQSGVDIESSGPISSAKLTIFVKDVPCNLVLDKIASVLGAEWKNLSGIRFVNWESGFSKEEAKYVAAEDKELRTHAEEDLTAILSRIEAENNASSGADGATNPGSSPLPFGGPPGQFLNRAMMADQIGKVLSSASQSDIDLFWKGTFASVEVGPDNTPPPRTPGVRRRPIARGSSDPAMVYARYDYYGTHSLQIGSSRYPMVSQRFEIPPHLQPEGDLAQTKFGKAVLAWSQTDVDKDDPLFNEAIDDNTVPKVGFGAVQGHKSTPQTDEATLKTQSDLLERFFKLSHVPVVADGFRTSLPQGVEEPKGQTSVAWLKSLASLAGSYVRIEDGIASVRQGGFWRLPEYEVPESVLKPMETNAAKLTLVDYARFFGGLTPSQARAFQSSNPPEVAFPTAFLSDSIPALRFISSLSSNFPVNGQPVPIGQLGGDSRTLLAESVADSVFSGKLWTKTDPSLQSKIVTVSLKPANVQQPEGTVPGVVLEILLPIGQTIDYEIPLPL
jgi:hypothetical protein